MKINQKETEKKKAYNVSIDEEIRRLKKCDLEAMMFQIISFKFSVFKKIFYLTQRLRMMTCGGQQQSQRGIVRTAQ